MQKMIKAVLTPPHSYAFEALPNEPFTSTLNHSTANRQTHLFELPILNVFQMRLQVISHLAQGRFCCFSYVFGLA
jgi:hypothetical protein